MYIVDGSADGDKFKSEEFLASLNLSESSTLCIKEILSTQMFHSFVEERCENPSDPEVLFFDDTINAKFNRSKKVVLTGRKKETAFLDDTRFMVCTFVKCRLFASFDFLKLIRFTFYVSVQLQITETYTPPPPSNFGLPDDGRSYQYSTFPKLDSNMYGKIRAPMIWQDQNRRDLLRGSGRRSSIAALRSEQAVVEKASRSLLSYGTKRRSRNLESALKILSLPFNGIPKKATHEMGYRRTQELSSVERDRSSSVVSNVTIPSEFDSSADMELTSAEEIVLNARRKQAILMTIIAKFQCHCHVHLENKRSRARTKKFIWMSQESELRNAIAAKYIQSWFRSYLIRQEYLQKKKVVLFLQAQNRGMKIRLAYHLLLDCVTHLQATCRGFIARRILESLATDRMNTYKEQIFFFWNVTSTPLSYRAQCWQIFKAITFLRLRIAEQEIVRLWKELKIPVQGDAHDPGVVPKRAGICLGSVHGISHKIYQSALKVRGNMYVHKCLDV
jgi:DENN domain-containing protein 5